MFLVAMVGWVMLLGFAINHVRLDVSRMTAQRVSAVHLHAERVVASTGACNFFVPWRTPATTTIKNMKGLFHLTFLKMSNELWCPFL
jgi:hypothetical protein